MLVDPVLSFDVSAIDIVLLVAVIILAILFVAQQRSRAAAESHLPLSSLGENSEKLETRGQSKSKEHGMKQSQLSFTKCMHNLGYLENLPQNTPVPDECFGCPNVMRCLFPNVPTQQVE